jgi:hypothetical protein
MDLGSEQRAARPTRWWYAVALVILVAGFALAGLFVFDRLTRATDALTRVDVPGEAQLPLEAGDYTIFHELQPSTDGVVAGTSDLEGLVLGLSGPDGAAVTLEAYGASGSYSVGGRTGRAVMSFTASEAGDYRLVAAYPDGADAPRGVLAIGKGFVEGILTTVFGALGIVLGAGAVAVVIAIRTFLRRRAAR